jgi:hypothetical protein
VNSINALVCMLKEISSLFHNFLSTDISNKQMVLILLLSLETVEDNKHGTSIKLL